MPKSEKIKVTDEKKCFTNVYWDKRYNSLVSRGIFGTAKTADERKVIDDEDLIYQDTVHAIIIWSYSGTVDKGEKK